MSDFTYGNLILSKDKEIAKEYLDPDTYLIEIDEKWVCRLAEADGDFNNKIDYDVFSDQVLSLSEHIPILFFAHPEDHGFGFAILKNREIVSSLYIDYEFDDNLPLEIANELHGRNGVEYWMENENKFIELADKQRSDRWHKVLSNMNLENMKLFDYTDEDINSLECLLTFENCRNENKWGMAEKFMEITGLQNMTFIAWRYIEAHENYYKIIAKK